MVSVQEKSLRSAVLGQVREELTRRAPADGYRPYDASRLSKDLEDAFVSVAKGKPLDASVSINAVVNAYAKTLKGSLDAVNQVGPSTVTAKEASKIEQPEMRGRLVALCSELARGNKPLGVDQLAERAARFVADHSAPINQSGNAIDVLFPAFDVGNAANWGDKEPGIDARLITDAKAAVKIMQILMPNASPGEAARMKTFDPAKEHLILVAGSDDETIYFPAAIDKKSGKARGFDAMFNSVDFPSPETKEDYEAMWGKGSAKKVTDEDYAYASYQRFDELFTAGKSLPIAKLDPPELDDTKLASAAKDALQKYFSTLGALPAGDFSTDDKKTLKAIRDAIKSGGEITIGEHYGSPALLMPRKFSGKPTEDYAVGWTMNELFKTVPEFKRFYNVTTTVQTPNP